MPRIVDHAARRKELAQAALSIVRAEGAEALSVRRLAAASGWSVGALRHYVPDMDALAGLLLEEVSARVQQGVADVLTRARLDDLDLLRGVVVDCLAQVVPLDPQREVEFAVWRYFWGRDRRGVEAEWVWIGQRTFYRQMVLLLAGRDIETATVLSGVVAEELEPWAGHLHACVDGLALRAALAVPPEPPEATRAALRFAVDVVADAVGGPTR